MIIVQVGDSAIIFNAQEQISSFRVGQGKHRRNQIAVGQTFPLALELNGQGFAAR
jgi:hypothetical protein